MKLLLDGFQNDRHDQAEAAVGDTDFAGFAAFQSAGGVTESGFHLFEVGWIAQEEGEVGDMAEMSGQKINEAPYAGSGMDFGEGEIVGRALVNGPIDEEGEVSEGAEVFHSFGYFLFGSLLFGLLW